MLTAVIGVALAVLAEAFRQQLVVPQPERFEPLAPGGKHADRRSPPGFHQPADADVVEHRIAARLGGHEPLGHGGGALEDGFDVQSHRGRRQQPDGSQHGEPAADVVGIGEQVLFLNAQGPAQLPELAVAAGHGGDPPGHLLGIAAARLAQGVDEQPEGHGRFERRAALADHDDPPAILDARARRLAHEVQKPADRLVVDVVPLKVDPRPAAPLLAAQLVVIGVADGLEQGPGTHVRPADPQDHHPVDLAGQPIGRLTDLGDFAILAVLLEIVEHPFREVDEAAVQRVLFRRQVALFLGTLQDRQIVGDLLTSRLQSRGQPGQIARLKTGLTADLRSLFGEDNAGIGVRQSRLGRHNELLRTKVNSVGNILAPWTIRNTAR